MLRLPERPRSPLHPALGPADHVAFRQESGGFTRDIAGTSEREAVRVKRLLHLPNPDSGPQ